MPTDPDPRTPPAPPPRSSRPIGLPRGVMALVGLAALVSLVLEYGFHLGAKTVYELEVLDYALAAAFGLDLLFGLLRSKSKQELLRRRWHEYALLLLFGVTVLALAVLETDAALPEFLGRIHLRSVTKLCLALVQLFLVLNLLVRALQAQERFLDRRVPAEFLLIGSFALLVILGTLLLWLPGARAPGVDPISLLDAFFTSTSASCVTGLAVRDTGGDFSLFGQLIVMMLFQVGGLGIITFVAFGSILSAKKFTVPQALALREVTNSNTLAEVRRSVWQVVLWMLLIEGVGCLALFLCLPAESGDPLKRFYWSLFHSISAFCNAGFSLQSDSLEGMRGALGINVVVMGLIVFGGLGMPVARELLAHRLTRAPFFRRWRFFQRLHAGQPHKRLSLQTRLSLWMTGGLLLVGFIGFWALEAGGTLRGLGAGDSALAAAFQSVTTRTAGFNTVQIGETSDGSLVLMMALMVVGAGPVSTGGGIKTVTFAVLLITLRAMVSGREGVEVAGRSLSRRIVRTAISVFVLYVMVAGLCVFVISITDPGIPMKCRMFESISALSTVGLSTGVTAQLSPVARIVLCLAMFAGRVGPLSLTLSIFRSRRSAESYKYPEEGLVVG